MKGVVRFAAKITTLAEQRLDGQLSVTKNRAALMLGISRSTVDRMVVEKELSVVMIHGREMISMLDLLRLTTPTKRGRKVEPPASSEPTARQDADAIRSLRRRR